MAQVGKSPDWVSSAHPPRGKWKGNSSLDGSQAQLGKENKPSAWDGSDTRSRSKIPVLSKSCLPPDFQQLHQAWQSQFQKGKAAGKKPCTQTCPFNLTCQGDKFHVVPCADMAAATEPPAGSPGPLSRSQPRGPLEEIQLGAAAQKNVPGSSVPGGKEVGPVEFVADPVALASILSNVGLGNGPLGVARKHSLARRVPVKGSRGNSVHASGTARTVHGSLYVASGTPALGPDPARFSCFSRLAPRDPAGATQDPAQHRGLLLNSQQIQGLSATLRDVGSRAQPAGHPALQRLGTGAKEACRGHPHPIATATQSELAGRQEAGGTRDQSSSGRRGSSRDGKGGKAGTGGQSAAHSSGSLSRTDPMGASRTEEFVPDPDALASVLANVGLSHAALGPAGKLSLARRVPVKGPRGTGSTTASVPPKGDFGRASCHSALGLKGPEAPDGLQAAQLAGTPRTQEISRSSPFGSARRVPVTQPQSLRGTCFSARRLAVFPRTPLDKRLAQGALQTPARWAASLSPEPSSSDPEELALPWEKIVVRLFGDGESQADVSVRKALAWPGEGSSKAQRIEILARLLRKEVEGAGDELHRLLAACALSPGPPRTPPPPPACLPSPSLCQDPGLGPASSPAFPAAGTTLTFSSQRPVCSHPLIRSVRSPSTSGGAAGPGAPHAAPPSRVALVKQRLGDLLGAPQRFQEACLDDECAFYTGRPPGSQPPASRCCMDPVATLLEAQETRRFLPITQLAPGGAPGEAETSRPAALPLPPSR